MLNCYLFNIRKRPFKRSIMANTMNKEDIRTKNSNDKVMNDSNIEEPSIVKDEIDEDDVDITKLRTPIKVDLSAVYNFLGARTTQAC